MAEATQDFVATISKEIAVNMAATRSRDAQIALSRLAALIDQLSPADIDKVKTQLSSVVPALTTDKPNIDFAERAVVNISNTLLLAHGGVPRAFYKIINGSAICSVYFALLCSLISFVALFLTCYFLNSKGLVSDFFTTREFILTVSFAFLGGMVSIAFRLDINEIERVGLVPLFLTNLLKPYIGAMFGIIVFCIIESRIILIPGINDHTYITVAEYKKLADDVRVWTYGGTVIPVANYLFYFISALLGFLSGFSERFAADLIDRSSRIFSADDVRQKAVSG
jgi:hypothetical protein